MPNLDKQNTTCPGCNALLINRSGFASSTPAIRDSKCVSCGEPIHGVELK